MCDVSPLEVCDVILGKPYMWKFHVMYESRPRSVIISLENKIYRILEMIPTIAVSLIIVKQYRKVISLTGKFILFMIRSKGERKITTTITTYKKGLSTQQTQLEKIVEAYKDIFTTSTRVPLHCQVKHSIDLVLGVPLHFKVKHSIDLAC